MSFGHLRPMRLEIETANIFGYAQRLLAGGVRMSIPGRIIVVENDDVGSLKLYAVARRPFGPLVRFGGTMRVAGCGNTEFPKIVRVLLTLNHANFVSCLDGFHDFIHSIEDGRIDALDPRFPTARAVWLLEPKARFKTRMIPHFAKTRHAGDIAIYVGRQLGLRASAAFWWPRPVTMIATPADIPVGFEENSEHFELLVGFLPICRAFGTECVILTGFSQRQVDAMSIK